MILTHLNLKNFKIWTSLAIKFSPHLNIISANNGTGKTTILNAIFLIDHQKLLYNEKIALGINKNAKYFINEYSFANQQQLEIQASELEKNYSNSQLSKNFRSLFLDSRDLVEFYYFEAKRLELLRKWIFSLDLELGKLFNQIENLEIKLKTIFESKQNNITKKKLATPLLNSLVNLQHDFLTKEKNIFKKLLNYFNQEYFNFFPDLDKLNFKFKYFFVNQQDLNLEKLNIVNYYRRNLNAFCNKEKKFSTNKKDKLEIKYQGKNFASFFSKGQVRVTQALLLIALVTYFQQANFIKPTLLLDDFFSELDQDFIKLLIKRFAKLENQIIITSPKNFNDNWYQYFHAINL